MTAPDRDTLVRILRRAPADRFMVGDGGAEVVADFILAEWPDDDPPLAGPVLRCKAGQELFVDGRFHADGMRCPHGRAS